MKIGVAFGMVAIAACLIMNIASVTDRAEAATATYERCGSGIRLNCIVDGDTIWSKGVKIELPTSTRRKSVNTVAQPKGR